MDTEKYLIDIASAAQGILDALVTSTHNGNDNDLTRKQLRGDLQRIVAAVQTLLTEILGQTSAEPILDDRLHDWLSTDEPTTCLETLQEMTKLIKSSSGGVQLTLHGFFRSAHVEDKLKQVIRVFEKRRDYFHFLLTTNVWNRETGTKNQPQGKDQSFRPGIVDWTTCAAERIWEGKIWSEKDHARLNETMQWLDAWDCTAKHEDTIELRQPGTCTWLLNTYEYETWRHANDGFLWLNGKPGSGKSVLAASVIDHIMKTKEKSELLSFFYCDFRSERSTIAAEVMRSLLSQLLQGLSDLRVDPAKILDILANEKRQKRSSLDSAKRLATLLCRLAKQLPQLLLVVVDALDECEDIDNLLESLLVLNEGGVRLFVISRPLQIIKDAFSWLSWLSLERMSQEVSMDIEWHVRKEFDSHRRLRIAEATLKEEIIQTLCHKADGMFRWVECQLKSLKQCTTTIQIRELLDSLPIGLEATYERIILAIGKDERHATIARRALVWLVSAIEQLHLREIVEALSIDVNRRRLIPEAAPIHGSALLDSLGSLVMHYEETDVIILSHFSVKEFLVGKCIQANSSTPYSINERDAHAQVAQQCMTYVAACLQLEVRITCDDHPLIFYALFHGFHHLYFAEPTEDILDHIVALSYDVQQHPSQWKRLKTYGADLPSHEHDFVLYILIRYAPELLLHLFLCRAPLTGKELTNPLIYTIPGRTAHAHILLSHGAKPGFLGGSLGSHGCHSKLLPIEVAVLLETCDPALLNLLLEEGSPVPHKLFSAILLEDDPLPIGADTFVTLLRTDEFMDWAIDVPNEKLLSCALDVVSRLSSWWNNISTGGDLVAKMIQRLQQIGCDLTGHSSSIKALVRKATMLGHISSVQHLLSDFQIRLPPDILLDYDVFLHSDAEKVQFFIHHGANVNAVLPDDTTALHLLLRCYSIPETKCLEMTKLLCEAGCNPSTSNSQGETPIHIAVSRVYYSVIQYLLSTGLTFLPPDILYARELSSSMFRFLISEGADTRFVAANGDTVLHSTLLAPEDPYAESGSEHEHELLERARILVGAGCNPSITNSSGQMPLDVATMVSKNRLLVIEYLLSLNLALSPSAFLWACDGFTDSNLVTVVKLLLKHGANPNETTPDGNNPLHLIVGDSESWCDDGQPLYHFQAFMILVNGGCDYSTRNANGEAVIHIAARLGNIKVIKYLLSWGAPLPLDILQAVGSYSETSVQMVQLLIDKGADVCVVTEDGDTPLHLAISTSSRELTSLEFVTLLITAGSNPCALNAAQETPMHVAASKGYISVMEYLLSLHVPFPSDVLVSSVPSSFHAKFSPLVRFLIDNGADATAVSVHRDTPLHLYMVLGGFQNDWLETTRILIEAGCDIHACNQAGDTPLVTAVRGGYLDTIKYLLSQGASLPPDVFLAAAASGSIDTMEYLLSQGVPVPPSSFLAAASGQVSEKLAVMRFISTLDGADIHYMAPDSGDTALHHAVRYWNGYHCLQTVKFLIDLGCAPSVCNSAGETPLHISASQCHIPVVEHLLMQGAPLPSNILLSAASASGGGGPVDQMMRLLIRKGANPCIFDDKGDTPLHILLTRWGFDGDLQLWKAVQVLLEARADPYARNLHEQAPVDLAEKISPSFSQNFIRLVKNAGDMLATNNTIDKS